MAIPFSAPPQPKSPILQEILDLGVGQCAWVIYVSHEDITKLTVRYSVPLRGSIVASFDKNISLGGYSGQKQIWQIPIAHVLKTVQVYLGLSFLLGSRYSRAFLCGTLVCQKSIPFAVILGLHASFRARLSMRSIKTLSPSHALWTLDPSSNKSSLYVHPCVISFLEKAALRTLACILAASGQQHISSGAASIHSRQNCLICTQ